MQARHYDENDEVATADRDMAILSHRLLAGVAMLASRQRAELEAMGGGPDLDLLVVIEERAQAEIERRRGRAA